MAELYGRRVYLDIGDSETGATKRYPGGGDGLRIGFRVDCNDGSAPNKAVLEAYGVSRDTFARARAENAFVRLYAGYESTGGARLVFSGEPIENGVKFDHTRPQSLLTIEAQDGGTVYRATHMSESYVTATTSGQLFSAIADAMGVPLGNVGGVVSTVSFPHGYQLVGRASDLMDRIASISGAKWQLRDGALQVWATSGSTGESAAVFSSEAGNLIGSPKPTDDGIEVRALLAPSLRPGRPFRVESRDYTGNYVATNVEFRGDSGWSREFYVVARGKAL